MSTLITPESGRHSQIPPEAVEIYYDGYLSATVRADIQTPALLAIAIHAV